MRGLLQNTPACASCGGGTFSVNPMSGHGHIRDAHGWQKISPQRRQWCLRRKSPNFFWQMNLLETWMKKLAKKFWMAETLAATVWFTG